MTLDGTVLGKTPITVGEIAPGEHTVVLAGDVSSVTHKVMVEAGAQASLVVPMGAQADTLTGYLSVKAPLVFELYEQGRLLGTSGIDRIIVPAGKHEIELVNGPLDYRETRTLQVTAGQGLDNRCDAAQGHGVHQRRSVGERVDRRPEHWRYSDSEHFAHDRAARGGVEEHHAWRATAGH